VPGAGNPQSLNRYTYVYNNPLAYIDLIGHDPSDWDQDWVQRYMAEHDQKSPTEQDWLDYLFSLEHPGSGPGEAWESKDWEAYWEIRLLLGPQLLDQIGSPRSFSLYTLIGRYVLGGSGVGGPFADETWLVYGNRVPSRACAWTWGDAIIVDAYYWIHNWNSGESNRMLIHEYVHVLQYRAAGIAFGLLYLAEERSDDGRNLFEAQAVAIEDWYRSHAGFPYPWASGQLPNLQSDRCCGECGR